MPLSVVSVAELFCLTPMVILLAPMEAMESVTELLMESPRVMIAMTDAIPMMIPSMVRRERILLARRL